MKSLAVCCVFLLVLNYSYGQKKPLDHTVYDGWQHIGERAISNDGRWVVYTIDPQQGDNQLVIQTTDGSYKKTVDRGYNAVITEDNRYVVFKIKAFFKDTRDAKIKKKKSADMPKDSIGIIALGKEEIWKKEKVKNFKAPEKSYGWVAYQVEDAPMAAVKKMDSPKSDNGVKKIADSLTHVIDSLEKVIQSIPAKKKKDDAGNGDSLDADGDETSGGTADTGSDLVLRNLSSGEEKTFKNVLEYYFSKTGNKLLIEIARNPKDSTSVAQVILFDCPSAKTTILSKVGNDFKNFTMTEDGDQIAYVAERDAQPKDLQKFYKLWYFKNGMDSAVLLADKFSVGMKLGMTISEFANLSFSKNGKKLFFGTAPIQPPKDTTLVDFEHAKLDIWHYKDDYLQTVQTNPMRLKAALQENFLAVYNFDNKTIKQLGSKEIPQVMQTNEGNGSVFYGVTDYGKRIQSQWQGYTLKDIYAIDVNTGEKKLIKENLYGNLYPSTTGNSLAWYDANAKNYFLWNGSSIKNISTKIKTPLYQEDWDTPEVPASYRAMGWQANDSFFYVYDKYDAWAIDIYKDFDAQPITLGRMKKNVYRYLKLDREEKGINWSTKNFFSVKNEIDKKETIASSGISGSKFGAISLGSLQANSIANVMKSKNADVIIASKKTFINSPDIYSNYISSSVGDISTASKAEALIPNFKLSSINPQQKKYNWGTVEQFKWKAYNGKDATGLIYKPEDFDPKKKYPMICYFYEKLSDRLYDYMEPAPIRSAINVPFFVSRGYIIFMPDISYQTGHPAKGAYDYIVSGARAVVKNGFVDSTKIAIQGHSWGGYQSAQLATMTKLFKAVWAGAPVANMTSAYGGIRWESGVNRQFQYEKTQSRIGATLWNGLPLYMENSPLFHLDKVTAPMVILHNDADGAVPWYQGIELFTAMRRLGKKVWMFNYNGQGHGLTQRQDMLDYQIRMQQFFDWILKGDKPAKWITEGVPAVQKGKDWGLEIVD